MELLKRDFGKVLIKQIILKNDGNAGCESGTIYSDNEGQFENNPTLLTLEEFKKLIEND